jgi:hypothetical protein
MTRVRVLLAAVFILGGFTSAGVPTVRAADRDDGSIEQPNIGSELAPGTTARFRVGWMKSRVSSPRSATVVSVTNEGTGSCTVSVDWRKGFSVTGPGGVVCTTTFAGLERGQTADLCSRSVPSEVETCTTVCSPELTFDQGNAVVGSTATAACAKITVSARTYYFTDSDTVISGITDPSIAKFGVGNVGD